MQRPRADNSQVDKEVSNAWEAIQKLTTAHNTSVREKQVEIDQYKKKNADLSRENEKLQATLTELQNENAKLRKGMSVPATSDYQKPATSGVGAVAGDGSFKLMQKGIVLHDQPVHDVAVHHKSQYLATASWDKTVAIYDLQKREVVKKLGDDDKQGGVYSVAFSLTKEDHLACASADCHVHVWNFENETHTTLEQHQDEVNGLDFHSSKNVLCSVSDDCKAIVWDFAERIALRVLDQHTAAVYGARFLGPAFEYSLATCCFDKKTRIFDMRDKQISQTLMGHNDDIIGIDITNNASTYLIATGSDDGHILVWDIRKNYQQLHDFDTRKHFADEENEVKRVAFSPGGEYIAAATSKGKVLVYPIGGATAAKPVTDLTHGEGKQCVFGVSWGTSPNGKQFLVSGAHDNTCSYWEVA